MSSSENNPENTKTGGEKQLIFLHLLYVRELLTGQSFSPAFIKSYDDDHK